MHARWMSGTELCMLGPQVSDTGAGIPPEQEKKIWGAFNQVSQLPSPKSNAFLALAEIKCFSTYSESRKCT
eukprot:2249577-Rhodomonas_salina.3